MEQTTEKKIHRFYLIFQPHFTISKNVTYVSCVTDIRRYMSGIYTVSIFNFP